MQGLRFFFFFIVLSANSLFGQTEREQQNTQIDAEIATLQNLVESLGDKSREASRLQSGITRLRAFRRGTEMLVSYLVVAPLAVATTWFASSVGAQNLIDGGALSLDQSQIASAVPILISVGSGLVSGEISRRIWDHLAENRYRAIETRVNGLLQDYAIRARAATEDAIRALALKHPESLDYAITRLYELGEMLKAEGSKAQAELLKEQSLVWNRMRRKFARLRVSQATSIGLVDIWSLQIDLLERLKTADDDLLKIVVERMKKRMNKALSETRCADHVKVLAEDVRLSHPPSFKKN